MEHRDHSVKWEIANYLQAVNVWVFGGQLCRAIHEITKAKEGVIEKRAREMAIDGEIERRYVKINGNIIELSDIHHGVVQFRALQPRGYMIYRDAITNRELARERR